MNKVNRVNVCVLCAEIECKEHPELWRVEYQCALCLFCHSLNREAQSCCMSLTNQTPVPDSCLAPVKQKRDKGLEYPTMAIAKKRGR